VDLKSRIEETKREVFVRRACDVAAASPATPVPSGRLGQELGLPYEQTLAIVGELDRRGWLHRAEALSPPDGPMVLLTAEGIRAARRSAA